MNPGGCPKINEIPHFVMLNLVQHLMKSMAYETLKRVQGDIFGALGHPQRSHLLANFLTLAGARV